MILRVGEDDYLTHTWSCYDTTSNVNIFGRSKKYKTTSQTTEEVKTSPEDAENAPSLKKSRHQMLSKLCNKTQMKSKMKIKWMGFSPMMKCTVSEIDYYERHYPGTREMSYDTRITAAD